MNLSKSSLLLVAPLVCFAFAGCDDDDIVQPGADAAVDAASFADAGGGPDGAAPDTLGGDALALGPDAGIVNPACAPADPNNYPTGTFEPNTVNEKLLLSKLAALNTAMASVETDPAKTVSLPELEALFSVGADSLKAKTTAYYAAQVEGTNGVLGQYAAASGSLGFMPGMTAGLWGTWIFNANGVDLRQQTDKGFMAAVQYKHLTELSRKAPVTPADVDGMVAIMNLTPAFPYDTPTDVGAAKYASRRSNRTNPDNLYLTIKYASIRARAAAAKPVECAADLASALATLRGAWEKALVTTTLFYAADTKKKLAAAATDADRAAALHALGEGIGFIHGFKGLPAQDRIITDAQIDSVLAELFALAPGTPVTGLSVATPHRFLSDIALPPRLDTAVALIKAVYGFTDAEVEGFKVNY